MATVSGGQRVEAVNEAAHRAGLRPGLRLADARALHPDVLVSENDVAADRRLLEKLAAWCDRYTPWVALDDAEQQGGGLWLDVGGCAHLFGGGETGERRLVEDLVGRLRGFGFCCRAALADTPGAAWALARFAEHRLHPIVPPGGQREALVGLPMAGLRLPPEAVDTLHRLGLRRIDDLYSLPRAPLTNRFGTLPVDRLDQALGLRQETIAPRRPAPPFRCRLAFAEPIGRPEDIAAATGRLLAALCGQLEGAGMGVRRLELALHRVDGSLATSEIGTSRPNRDPAHLMRLFGEPLAQVDAGFGVELMMLAARTVEPCTARQTELTAGRDAGRTEGTGGNTEQAVGELVDRLSNRLGAANVIRLRPRQSHLPERVQRRLPAAVGGSAAPALHPSEQAWAGFVTLRAMRPVRLLSMPEPIDVTAPVPDDPPLLFRWRQDVHRVVRVDGPERLANEWWREREAPRRALEAPPSVRDYYRVEADDGQRYWIYRDGPYNAAASGTGRTARWFLHGFCA